MGLIQQWEDIVTAIGDDAKGQQKFWTDYYLLEKGIYEKMLEEPVEDEHGTVKELAEKYGTTPVMFAGFLDGINESIKTPNNIEELEEDSVVAVEIELEKLYYNMVAAKADWLYNLPQWENLLPEAKRSELYKAQKKSMTIVKGPKIGRNDPCPCGSGKKYKHCCGR